MKYISKVLIILFFALTGIAMNAAAQVGMILEVQGDVSITRSGSALPYIDIGDEIHNYDLIRTGRDGVVVVDLYSKSGMEGTLSVAPSSVFTLKMEQVRNEAHTEANLLGGSVGVKVRKLAGTPSLRIRSGSTAMGVRGTQFEVHISVNDSILVTCTEGRVNCAEDGGESLDAVPGQAVQKAASGPLKLVPVAVSSLETYTENWYAEEISAFRAAPIQVLDQYARSYERYIADFREASDALSVHPVFIQWKSEDRSAVVPHAQDPKVMQEKTKLFSVLIPLRRILFFFEKTYYRLEEVESYIPQTALQSRLSNGQTAGAFLRQLRSERAELQRRTAEYRYALSLYAQRNDGSEPLSLDQQNDEDFFDSLDSFFD